MVDLNLSVARRTSTSEQVCCQETAVATVYCLAALLTNGHTDQSFWEKIFVFFEV